VRYNSFTARRATIAARHKHNMLSFALGSMLKAARFFSPLFFFFFFITA
jgi:hypothetical protein